MKRFWKIFGITLGAIVGVLLVAVCVAIWLIFTPARLTPIVRQVADKYITCEHSLGEVDLTFFSTFPEFGLRVDGLCLINPTEGAQSDTLLAAPEVVATVNVMEFLQHSNLVVKELSLPDAVANIYIAADGATNFDVFALSSDTTAADTTSSGLPFDQISVDAARIEGRYISFVNEKDSISAALANTTLAARIGSWDDVLLTLQSEAVSAMLGGTQYADSLQVAVSLPAAVDLDKMHFALRKATLQVNEFALQLDGTADLADSVSLNMHARARDWQIEPLLALLPASLTDMLRDIEVDGRISLDADVQGVYSSSQMPLVDAHVVLEDGRGKYAALPYTLRDVTLDADAHIDLNDDKASPIQIHSLTAKTRDSRIDASGEVSELLADMLLDLQLNADLHLPDIAYFLPDNMLTTGQGQGKVRAKIRLSDLTAMHLERGQFSGDIHLQGIDFQMDSMRAKLPDTRLQFTLPNPKPSRKTVGWLAAQVSLQRVDFEMADALAAQLGQTGLQIETSNILGSSPVLCATLGLQSAAPLQAAMDSMEAAIAAPSLTAYAEYNTKDTTAVPTLQANLAFDDLRGYYADIQAHLAKSSVEANLRPGKRNKSVPRLETSVRTNALDASMGEDVQVKTAALSLKASARYNKQGENLLLQWNPKLDVDLQSGEAHLAAIDKPVYIPQITFTYSNKDFQIAQSQVRVGNSDFALSGEVQNIGAWLRKQGTLEGELNFVSEHTDVNELMALCSADSGSEETADDKEQGTKNEEQKSNVTEEASPFLVPLGVDVALNTHIKEAVVFNEVAHDLKGKLYIKDGTLVLDEMGFVCNAAKLQLTAMYRTPRRNHIYVGLDYHMIDIDIAELIHMIPQLDSIVPMLRSFKGAAEFHLAAETYTNAKYEIKPSTLRGACSIFGKDLVVMDSETFSKISKLLLFNKKTENRVDSISAELTVYKKEIDVYPFCVSLDNYMVALGGRHNLDMTFDYDINVLSPIYLGVNVSGNIDDLKIKLAKCKFAKDFRPVFHGKTDTQSAELRQMIRDSMRKNVKIK